MHFPLKLKKSCWPQLHPIIWIKSISKNWKLKFFIHFFTRTLCWGWAIVRIFEPLLYLSLIISNISILLIGSVLWYQTSLKNQISATVPSVTLSKFSFPWETLSLWLLHTGILCLKLGLFHKLEGGISQITYKHGPDKNDI